MPTLPRSPSEHHYVEAEQGLAGLGSLGPDEPERLVETLVALVHAVLSIAAGLGNFPAPGSSDDDGIAFGRDF